MQSALVPFVETNAGLAAFFLALVVVPVVSKLSAYFATASLLEQIEDAHSHPSLVRRYRSKSTNWYEKGIIVTLSFFEKVYGVRKFSQQAFVTSMQIAVVYFWIAAVLAAVILALLEGPVITPWKVEVPVNIVIALACVWFGVKVFFLSGRLLGHATLARPLVRQICAAFRLWASRLRVPWIYAILGQRRLYRICFALLLVVAYHFAVVSAVEWLSSETDFFEAAGKNSPEGYLGFSTGFLLISVYLALGFRFIVEAGIFYPLFGVLFAVFFFKNDHSGFMVAVFAFLVYPVSNAVFDFISIGATRSFLGKILHERLHFKAVVRNLSFDLLVALVSFAGFILTTVTMVSFISVFILGGFLGADAKTVRSMDPLGFARYAGFIAEVERLERPQPGPRPSSAPAGTDDVAGKTPEAGAGNPGEINEIRAMIIIACLFGATTFAPSLAHLLIVCSNNYSQRTKSWSSAVAMLEAPPDPISKAWSNDVLRRIRRGHLWGWSVALWGVLLFGIVVF